MKIHPSSRLCLDGPFVMPEDIMRVSPVILHVFHQPLDPNLEFRSGVTLGIDCDVDFTLEEDELLFLLTAPQEPVINARCQLEYRFVQLVPATTGKSGAKQSRGMITATTSVVIPASKIKTSKRLQQYHSRKPTPQKLPSIMTGYGKLKRLETGFYCVGKRGKSKHMSQAFIPVSFSSSTNNLLMKVIMSYSWSNLGC